MNWIRGLALGPLFLTFLLLLLLPFSMVCHAQGLSALPGDAQTSRQRAPALPLPQTPRFDLRIETPERSAIPRAADELEFRVNTILIDGMTRYALSDFAQQQEALTSKPVSLEDLRQLAQRIEERYKADGYFLVRVFVPPQRVSDGVFRLQVIEGFISQAFVEGGSPTLRALIQKRLVPLVNKKPIDLASLEHALLLLNDLPGLAGSGVLRQGASLGASELVVSLNPLPLTSGSLSINNTASKSMGTYGTSAALTLNNLSSIWPSSLALSYASSTDSERLKALSARLAFPLPAEGLIASLSALQVRARPAGSLQELRLLSRSESVAPRLRSTLSRSRLQSVYLDTGLSFNQTRTTSQPLGLKQAVSLSQDKTRVIDLGLSLTDEAFYKGSAQLTATLYQAFQGLGSEAPEEGYRHQFTKLGLLFNTRQPMTNGWVAQLQAQGQWAGYSLISAEQIAFGGATGIGRGYDGGAIAGDRGLGFLLEISRPLTWAALQSAGRLNTFAFIDYAQVYQYESPTLELQSKSFSLGSHGLGLRWLSPRHGLAAELLATHARQTIKTLDSRGDRRLLFNLSVSF